MASCKDCRYCSYSPSWDTHLGKDGDRDWWCEAHNKWLHSLYGSCSDYEED